MSWWTSKGPGRWWKDYVWDPASDWAGDVKESAQETWQDVRGSAKDAWDDVRGKTAEEETKRATEENLAQQNRALDYMIEADRFPRERREAALAGLGMMTAPGGMVNAYKEIERSQPYQYQLAQAEQAANRNMANQGMNMSAAKQAILAGIAPQLQQQMYNQRVGQLERQAFGIPSGAGQIAGQMSNIGNIGAQGIIGAAQARQAGTGQLLGLGAKALGAYFSDPKLKTNVEKIATWCGFNWYHWTWNDLAKEKLGFVGESFGVMADEVQKRLPKMVERCKETGFLKVNYSGLSRG